MPRPLRLGLLGDPVEHSLSPRFQSAALAATGLLGSYEALRTPAGTAAARLAELAARGWTGLNVTLPLKEEVFALLAADPAASLSSEARRVGAVNTLRRTEAGWWEGHNTDVEGFTRAVLAEEGALGERHVVVLGAGGAARAVLCALLAAGCGRISFWNRGARRRERLLADFEPLAGKSRLEALPSDIEHCPADAALIVQATSLGLALEDPLPPLPVPGPHSRAVDLVTRPSAWQDACRRAGCRVEDGREMLLQQGAASFTYWTGLAAPLAAMRAALAS